MPLLLVDRGWPDNKKPKIERRIRIGKMKGDDTWEKIQAVIHHPLANREVWIFLGKTLSKSRLEKVLGQDIPRPEAVNAMCLLRATLADVSSVGAKMRVFCYP